MTSRRTLFRVAIFVLGFALSWLSFEAVRACAQARPLSLDGVEGLWLPPEDAREAESAITELPRAHERIRILGESLTIADRQIEILLQANALTEEGRLSLRSAIDDVGRNLSPIWHPALWCVIGIALGFAGAIAAALAI